MTNETALKHPEEPENALFERTFHVTSQQKMHRGELNYKLDPTGFWFLVFCYVLSHFAY